MSSLTMYVGNLTKYFFNSILEFLFKDQDQADQRRDGDWNGKHVALRCSKKTINQLLKKNDSILRSPHCP